MERELQQCLKISLRCISGGFFAMLRAELIRIVRFILKLLRVQTLVI
jgi:hypothetical protein